MLGRPIPGIGVVITVGVVLSAGFLFSLGPLKRVDESGDQDLDAEPVVYLVYGTSTR